MGHGFKGELIHLTFNISLHTAELQNAGSNPRGVCFIDWLSIAPEQVFSYMYQAAIIIVGCKFKPMLNTHGF
jgi:hypothetical protein